MGSALDVIKSAGKLVGVYAAGETPSDEDASDSLLALNYLIDSWNNQKLALYNIINVTGNLIAGKKNYTIGTNADINTPRPVKIEKAFVRVLTNTTPIDYMVQLVSNEDYQSFAVKNIQTTYPTHVYYDDVFPIGTLYFYPVPSQAIELYLSVWQQLSRLALTDQILMPIGYENALRYGLAVELAALYGKPINRGHYVFDTAAKLLREIKVVNQDSNVARLDSAIVGNHSARFNILRG